MSQNIRSITDIGIAVRQRRKSLHLKQAECANLCGVGTRFLSELENGKPSLEIAKVLAVLNGLGLELAMHPRTWGGL